MTIQDFGDHEELYQSLLNRLTRHIVENPRDDEPNAIPEFLGAHDISAILAQIESEEAAKQPLHRGRERVRGRSTVSNRYHSPSVVEHGEMIVASVAYPVSVIENGETRGANPSVSPLRRSLRLQPMQSVSPNLPTMEVGTSQQKSERATKRRRMR